MVGFCYMITLHGSSERPCPLQAVISSQPIPPTSVTVSLTPFLQFQLHIWMSKGITGKQSRRIMWDDKTGQTIERLTSFRPYVFRQMHAHNKHKALVIVETSHIGTCAVRANFSFSPFEGALKNASVISAN